MARRRNVDVGRGDTGLHWGICGFGDGVGGEHLCYRFFGEALGAGVQEVRGVCVMVEDGEGEG